jgi:chemotaxis protein MotB
LGKKHKCPEFENHERWLVSFADMMTLLFALFVVLFALKEGSDAKIDQAAAALQETFSTQMDDIPIERRVMPREMGMGIFEHLRGDSIRPALVTRFPSERDRLKVIDAEVGRLKNQLEKRLPGPNRNTDKNKPGQERVVSVHQNGKNVSLRLLARHFYAPGAIGVRQSALKEIDELAVLLKELGRHITIEGHTDPVPPSDSMTNWELSSRRASFIVNYFEAEHNYPVSNLSIAGYADTRPIAANNTESGRSLNRRIEIKIHYDD